MEIKSQPKHLEAMEMISVSIYQQPVSLVGTSPSSMHKEAKLKIKFKKKLFKKIRRVNAWLLTLLLLAVRHTLRFFPIHRQDSKTKRSRLWSNMPLTDIYWIANVSYCSEIPFLQNVTKIILKYLRTFWVPIHISVPTLLFLLSSCH